MDNIDIKDFQSRSQVVELDNILLSLSTGVGGKMTVALFKAAIRDEVTPSINNNTWWIGTVDTGVVAVGKTPQFRAGEYGIEWKYTSDETWQLLVNYDSISLKFSDLTTSQKNELKLKFSDLTEDDIAALQQPAQAMIATLTQTNTDVSTAESARVAAESAREQAVSAALSDIAAAISAANTAASNVKDGKTPVFTAGTVSSGETPSMSLVSDGVDANGNPKYKINAVFKTGEKGDTGKTPTLEFGTITTGAAGSNASASLTTNGTDASGNPKYKLNLTIPRGDKGDDGKTTQFEIGTVSKTAPGGNPAVSLTDNGVDASGNPKKKLNVTLPTGDTGPVPGLSIGTVQTVAPGGQSSATLTDDGLDPNGVQKYKLNLVLVQGATGTIENIDSLAITFTQAGTRANINTGETFAVLFGKIKKFFADLGTMAFKSSVLKADLDSAVQTSLGKADTALQSFTETDPTVPSWAKATNKPSYTATEVGALPSSHNTDVSAHADIRSEVAAVRLIAEGALVGYAFDTVAAMNTWIAIPANKAKLKVGNSLFIRALDVPDYWWDGTQALMQESDKVDLTGYLLSSVAASTYVAKETGKSLMTDAERTKLSTVQENANNYSLPTASASTKGGVKVGNNLSILNEILSAIDTTYSNATTSAAGLMSSTDKTKLDGLKSAGEAFTANEIPLNNPQGTFRVATASNVATYTLSSTKVIGAWAKIRVNRSSEPAVTGGTKILGSDFEANVDMYLLVSYDGNRTEYYFAKITG